MGERSEDKLLLATLNFGCSVTVMCWVMSGDTDPLSALHAGFLGLDWESVYSAGEKVKRGHNRKQRLNE